MPMCALRRQAGLKASTTTAAVVADRRVPIVVVPTFRSAATAAVAPIVVVPTFRLRTPDASRQAGLKASTTTAVVVLEADLRSAATAAIRDGDDAAGGHEQDHARVQEGRLQAERRHEHEAGGKGSGDCTECVRRIDAGRLPCGRIGACRRRCECQRERRAQRDARRQQHEQDRNGLTEEQRTEVCIGRNGARDSQRQVRCREPCGNDRRDGRHGEHGSQPECGACAPSRESNAKGRPERDAGDECGRHGSERIRGGPEDERDQPRPRDLVHESGESRERRCDSSECGLWLVGYPVRLLAATALTVRRADLPSVVADRSGRADVARWRTAVRSADARPNHSARPAATTFSATATHVVPRMPRSSMSQNPAAIAPAAAPAEFAAYRAPAAVVIDCGLRASVLSMRASHATAIGIGRAHCGCRHPDQQKAHRDSCDRKGGRRRSVGVRANQQRIERGEDARQRDGGRGDEQFEARVHRERCRTPVRRAAGRPCAQRESAHERGEDRTGGGDSMSER